MEIPNTFIEKQKIQAAKHNENNQAIKTAIDDLQNKAILKDGTVAFTGAIQSTVTTGTAPLTVASTTKVTNLNVDKVDGADLDTDGTLTANSDVKIPSQKAVKTYADTKAQHFFAVVPVVNGVTNGQWLRIATLPASFTGDIHVDMSVTSYYVTNLKISYSAYRGIPSFNVLTSLSTPGCYYFTQMRIVYKADASAYLEVLPNTTNGNHIIGVGAILLRPSALPTLAESAGEIPAGYSAKTLNITNVGLNMSDTLRVADTLK